MPKKEARPFTADAGAKVSMCSLRSAIDKAVMYLTTDTLPPHWDRDLLFGEHETDESEVSIFYETDESEVFLLSKDKIKNARTLLYSAH